MIAIALISGCATKKADTAASDTRLTCVVGSVAVTNAAGTSREAAPGMSLFSGDTIVTQDASFAVIQTGDTGIVRVEQKTRLEITALAAQTSTDLVLKEGKVITKVSKLGKSQQFTIKTPTLVAAVRGTEFAVESVNGRDVVAVRDGKVAVAMKSLSEAKETIVDAGKAAVVLPGAAEVPAMRDIEKSETDSIAKVSTVEFVPNIKNAAESDINAIFRKIIENEKNTTKEESPVSLKDAGSKEAQIKKLIAQKPKSIAEIKAVFDRIDEISLYSGKVVRGAIIERGTTYSVLPTDGVVKIPEDTIRQTSVVR